MTINRVTLVGYAGKDARTAAMQNGKSRTRLSIATSKRYKDADGNWQEKTQWHTCVAYSTAAEYASKIQTGAHLFIEGELVYREYERTIETESGPVKLLWPVTEVVIDSISLLDRKDKQETRGAAWAPPPETGGAASICSKRPCIRLSASAGGTSRLQPSSCAVPGVRRSCGSNGMRSPDPPPCLASRKTCPSWHDSPVQISKQIPVERSA